MRFGAVPTGEAEGALLAHATLAGGRRLPKGHRLTLEDIDALRAGGTQTLVVARLEDGDVPEDEAAGRIAAALVSDGVELASPGTGRANLHAGRSGLVLPDRALVDAVNRIHPGITLATLGEFAPAGRGRMVATVKIIPLAVPGEAVDRAVRILRSGRALALAPFRARGIGLVQTRLPAVKPATLDKTRRVLERRLGSSGSPILREARCPHDEEALAERLAAAEPGEELTIVFGASAVIDEADVVPAAIRRAGGEVVHLGMPVDPGNLLLLGRIGPRVILGAPGCARSPVENGFDWILNRILADLEVAREDIVGLGVGGLLMEIASRPQLREAAPREPEAPARIHALVLAAGRSSRMGGPNKLLARFDGLPLVRRTVDTALASRACGVTVVTGHMAEAVEEALAGAAIRTIRNPRYAVGLSTSLAAGFQAVAGGCDGILVLLADQPLLSTADLDRMIAAFDPAGVGSIVLATDGGKRGNPVILSTRFASAVAALEGDVGARSIVQAHADLIREVEIGRAASLDVDTPELLHAAGGSFD
ncbi:4-diphosphocytidyl-2C-methyl-D-erythritol kinase [Aureimonas flava]|uniref:4-diphosphocytidyl-2C-methyl-D-erythritol kinase n=1 Tax=Aureimonas flava TaxID=2320271 RepID=A0A3A1WSF0_9HYPH|nr:molybdopterin-binding/glycosyltransferase family 2 protein [Aureimonas flava]RIY03645.1 4-diphosphocytidyl-2C-methyl-D-erythritol kinase [Aureimonas flava]